ncbi:tryptophan synthase subunit alpha [uncultured Vagococcus sp.]|uniref:tryptophan synthase subunit alpha n=1 Tax=uncultured Vagococcus sp. TaxID=189676 RepID=UPI0028D0DAD4|nr:tryptophan synthase subunit alpha [uncultured Vagococcus sp.]
MKKLVIYLTFMYPDEEQFYQTLDMLNDCQVDVVELGVPVLEPYMDGEIIQESHREVLALGLTPANLKRHLEEIRSRYNFEVTLMTYKSGIEYFDILALPEKLYDGLLCVDQFISINDSPRLVQLFNEQMTLDDCKDKLNHSSQFHYVMSGLGKTGTFNHVPTGYQITIPFVRSQSDKPIYVGFGIKTAADVAEVCEHGADGVVIGSHFMALLKHEGLAKARKYIKSLQAVL